MAYPDRWNAIHRLVAITETLVDESVEMNGRWLPEWFDRYNPFHKSKSRILVENYLIKNLKDFDIVYGFRATVTHRNIMIFIEITDPEKDGENYDKAWNPTQDIFEYGIKYGSRTDEFTISGRGLQECIQKVEEVKKKLDTDNGQVLPPAKKT